MKTRIFLSVWLLPLLAACGDPTVDVNGRYEPKIVIDAILMPGRPVQNIRLHRNLPLRSKETAAALSGAAVLLTDETSAISRALVYDSLSQSFHDSTWTIFPARTYRLDVDAVIDGKSLSASSRTTTPAHGFALGSPTFDSLAYDTRDADGKAVKIGIPYSRTVGIGDYVFSFRAMDADPQTFIYSPDNPFADVDSEDVAKDLDDYARNVDMVINAPKDSGSSVFHVELFHTWFYGRYQVIGYAVDRNFKDFVTTHNDVLEEDGNYHEPVFHIDGDGIGVFGSAIADTAFFKVLKRP